MEELNQSLGFSITVLHPYPDPAHVFLSSPALTHTPNISIPQTLELGRPTDVICSVSWACERGTPPIFSWMSAALITLGPTTTFSSVVTLTPRLQDHGTNLTCQVTFPGAGVTVRKTVQINVICEFSPRLGIGGSCIYHS